MNTYWGGNGAEQAKYSEMHAAGFAFTKKTLAIFRSYYRYFNDGDVPGWARGKWQFRGVAHPMNAAGEAELERRTTEAILAEYKRFRK